MRLRNLLFVLLIAALPTLLTAQYYDAPTTRFEVGFGTGSGQYFGELGNNAIGYSFDNIRPSAMVYGQYHINNWISLRTGYAFVWLEAYDSDADSEARQRRNLSFRSFVHEGSLLAQFNILEFDPYYADHQWTPYVFAGMTVFHFNPQTNYAQQWVDLQPLGTEGQGIPGLENSRPRYSLTQMAIPVGFGVKYNLNERFTFGIEFNYRYTFTDYIDDVSTTYADPDLLRQFNGQLAVDVAYRGNGTYPEGSRRGNPDTEDHFMTSSLTVGYNLYR